MSSPYRSDYDTQYQDNNGGKGWALGFGLLAGIAIGYYLNSNEGRAARRKAQVRFDEYGNQVSEKYNEYAEQARVKGQEYAETARQQLASTREWANSTAEQVKNSATQQFANLKQSAGKTAQNLKSGATDSANSVADSFKRGMDRAKANVDGKSEKIEAIVETDKSKPTPTPATEEYTEKFDDATK